MLKPWRLLVAAVLLLIVMAIGVWWVGRPTSLLRGGRTTAQFEQSEDAYRANNRGVALLEQFNYSPAVDAFRNALQRQPDLPLARLNLGIALFYLPAFYGTEREAQAAAATRG